ncbi:MAG: sulfatase [Sandaracinaceae bacterium]
MRRACWSGLVLLSLSLFGVGCGGSDEDDGAPSGARPAQADGLETTFDMLELSHLADIDHHGLYVDFGGAARNKYTVGNWGSGWGRDGADGDVTYTNVGATGRVYFPVREEGALTLRFQMKPVGSHRMQVFFNGRSLEGVVLEPGEQFRNYDVTVPADRVRAGENYLLLRFGGTTVVGGEDVAVSMGSIRVISGDAPEDDASFSPPQWDMLVSAVELGSLERQALAFRGPSTLSYHLEVPEHGRFIFGLGAEGSGAGATARVRIHPEGGDPEVLFEAAPTDSWNDQSLDLSEFAGRVVRMDLEVSGESQGRVAWSTPAVMIAPPDTSARPDEAQNVVVLLIDTLRASKLRPYNRESRVRTPVLDRIASGGVLFEQAQSVENWTKPSCASVLTGLTPMTHGAKTSEARLSENAELVSEAFHDAGFATGSFIANGYVSDRFGFDQGWDSYNNFIRDGRSTEAENVFSEAGDFIEQHRDGRCVVYSQTVDPHVPYDPPAEYLAMYDTQPYSGRVTPRDTPELLESAKQNRLTFSQADRRRLEALHDAEITQHDHHLGEFMARLERLGVADNTVLVITSDHGEEFDDHGSWGHGHNIFQELIGVPLIFHGAGLPSGRRVPYTVSTMNIAQTVLDLSGVNGLERAEGRSLVPDLLGARPEGPQVAFSDFQEIRRVARAGNYKLVVRANLSSVLFDLGADPGEQNELEVHDLPIAGRYTRILLGQYLGAQNRRQWLQANQDEVADLEAEEATMDDTIREQLRALGYAN